MKTYSHFNNKSDIDIDKIKENMKIIVNSNI